MFIVTERAKEKLQEMRIKSGAGKYTYRLRQAPGRQIGMVLDEPTSGDRVVDFRGADVLAIDRELLRRLDGWQIDARTEGGASRLILVQRTESAGAPAKDENGGKPPFCRWYSDVEPAQQLVPSLAH